MNIQTPGECHNNVIEEKKLPSKDVLGHSYCYVP